MPLLGEHYRCSICNAVNNAEIATYPDEYRHQTRFVVDPSSSLHVICLECRASLDDVDGEWLDDDDNEFDPDEDDFFPE